MATDKVTEQLGSIIWEQQEIIILLIESIETGGTINEDNLDEMLKRAYRIRDKARKLRRLK